MSHVLTGHEGVVPAGGDRTARLEKLSPIGGLVGALGVAILAITYFGGYAKVVPGAYLFGWYFWLTITLGMFGLSILHHTIRPSWSLPFLRLFEAGGGPVSLIVMAVLFLPLAAFPASVYPWADPNVVAKDHVLQYKAAYLNHPFWLFRYVLFFAIWIWLSGFMKRSERKQELSADFALEKGRSSWGAFGMVICFLTITFAIIDWIMSTEPHWSSTMMPLWQIIASCLGASSFCVATVCLNAKKEPYLNVVGPNLTKDWGNILFMFSMLWAYTAVSQFLIIWNGNLPETTSYYAKRALDLWNVVGMMTIVGQFLVPWMSLLSPRVKRYPRLLMRIAGWIFFIHIVDVYLAVGPAVGQKAFDPIPLLIDICAWFAVGGIWLFVFGNQVSKAPLLVSYDQRLQEALLHAH